MLQLANTIKMYEGNKPGQIRLVPKNETYIWVTRGDEKVRPEHSALDGEEERSWYDDPHPGEEYGCRCSVIKAD